MKTIALSLILAAFPVSAQKSGDRQPPSVPSSKLPVLVIDSAQKGPTSNPATMPQARTIVVGPKDLIPVRLRVGFSTMLILPASDGILEVSCGDKEGWVVNGADNVVHLKPVRDGARTNLNVISRSGRYFSFLLTEVSKESPPTEPDLKLFIEPKDELFVERRPVNAPSKAAQDEALAERNKLRSDLESANHRAEEEVKRRIDYPYSLRFGYRFESKAPFFVASVFDDGTATFIRTDSREAGTLYEVEGSKRVLTRFTYRDGLYVATKVIREGCLVVDKKNACFSRVR